MRLENITTADNFTLVGDSDMLIASVVAPAKTEEVEVEAELEGIDTDTAEQSEEESSDESEVNNEDQSE